MKTLMITALLGAATAVSAQAPTVQPPTVGAVVVGSDNQDAGRVVEANAQTVVLDTGTNRVAVATNTVGRTDRGFYIGSTKAQLDAFAAQAAQQAQASFAAKMMPGTTITGLNGAPVGSIKAVEGDVVTLTTPSGDVRLPRTGFAAGPNDTVRIGLTQPQLEAAIAAARTGR